MDLNVRKSVFYPNADLTTKQNYKHYSIVEPDGSIIERVFLDIPIARIRERIIFRHYLSRRVKFFYDNPVGFNVLSRDSPWDFTIELSSGESFNIEITSIAEEPWIFEMLKREERLLLASYKESITAREYLKLSKYISGGVNSNKQVFLSPDEIIPNPFYNLKLSLIGGIGEVRPNLSQLIQIAIQKKQAKKHEGKDNTILVIDNRTFRYEVEDLVKAAHELEGFIVSSPFMEIWFYTGYYSSLDGNDAEYNFCPLKINGEQVARLNEYIKAHKIVLRDGVLMD